MPLLQATEPVIPQRVIDFRGLRVGEGEPEGGKDLWAAEDNIYGKVQKV